MDLTNPESGSENVLPVVAETAPKPGVKTTEFWSTVLGSLLMAVLAAAPSLVTKLPAEQATEIADAAETISNAYQTGGWPGVIMALVSTVPVIVMGYLIRGYQADRAWVKRPG